MILLFKNLLNNSQACPGIHIAQRLQVKHDYANYLQITLNKTQWKCQVVVIPYYLQLLTAKLGPSQYPNHQPDPRERKQKQQIKQSIPQGTAGHVANIVVNNSYHTLYLDRLLH